MRMGNPLSMIGGLPSKTKCRELPQDFEHALAPRVELMPPGETPFPHPNRRGQPGRHGSPKMFFMDCCEGKAGKIYNKIRFSKIIKHMYITYITNNMSLKCLIGSSKMIQNVQNVPHSWRCASNLSNRRLQ